MECYKIITLKREKDTIEYLKYYLFPQKLVGISNKSRKAKEYKFENKTKVEEKISKILKTKLSIGFSFVNDNINPIFYNQFNDAMKGFDAIFENKQGIRYRFDRIMDSDQNSFISPFNETAPKYFYDRYGNLDSLINLLSTFHTLGFGVDLNRHGMTYNYRFSLDPWDLTRWDKDEPSDKIHSELGKSILAFIASNELPEKISFWTKIRKKLNTSTSTKQRFFLLSKGLLSFLDSQTGKIYSVEDYEPRYDKPVRPSDIVVHQDAIEYMSYVWNRLQEDIFYSMEYK